MRKGRDKLITIILVVQFFMLVACNNGTWATDGSGKEGASEGNAGSECAVDGNSEIDSKKEGIDVAGKSAASSGLSTNEADTKAAGSSAPVKTTIQEDFPRTTLAEAGIHQECIDLIEEIITTDIENGFPSAQLAIVRDGKLVYEKGFGTVNAYYPDGTRKTDSAPVTTETLYDLASISKMIGVNYAIQKLVTDGELDINEKVSDYLGSEFYENTIYIDYADGVHADLETTKKWKSELTIAHLLKHMGGFAPSPKFHNPTVNPETLEYDPEIANPLYSSVSGDESAKKATIEKICETPLMYEPGTKVLYSDVDYMILGLVVEAKTGKDLDTYLKETFAEPLGLSHITYAPLDHGFDIDQIAATELNGNTRDGYVTFPGIRTETIQGQVHDETAYYCMGGMSGHAGIFSNATNLAMLGSLMIDGTYNGQTFFSQEVIDQFTAPKSANYQNWGLGWWRQGDMQRTKYFGTKAGPDTIGHQGWTGTLLMIDPEKKLVIAYLTNKINSPVINKEVDSNKFLGSRYTSSTLGFVPEILYVGLDSDEDVTEELAALRAELLK